MKQYLIILLIGILAMALIVGCEKDSTGILSEEMQEELELQEFAMDDENDYLFDWGIDDGDEQNMYNGFSTFATPLPFEKIAAPINNVVRFGRKINHRFPRTLVIRRIAPDTVKVFIERVLVGKFLIFEEINSDTTNPDTLAIYRKPLRHIVRRAAIFVRRKNISTDTESDNARGRWKLHALTLSQGNSSHSTIRIHEVSIFTENGDSIVFTAPLDTYLVVPRGLPTFAVGEEVKVKVKLENNTANPVVNPETGATETVLLHYGANPRHHARKEFEFIGVDPSTGLNVYEGKWIVHQRPFRPYHAVVDAIDNGTIYDNDPDAFPYNSATWGTPYRVLPLAAPGAE